MAKRQRTPTPAKTGSTPKKATVKSVKPSKRASLKIKSHLATQRHIKVARIVVGSQAASDSDKAPYWNMVHNLLDAADFILTTKVLTDF